MGCNARAGSESGIPGACAPRRYGRRYVQAHALRLGFRKIKGFSEQDAALIVAARRGEPAAKELPYASVRDLWLRTGLFPRVIERLAEADAFGSIGLTRRQALWAAKALGRVGDKEDDLPLFQVNGTGMRPNSLGLSTPEQKQEFQELGQQSSYRSEPEVALPPMPLGEEVVNDYRSLELSLRAHPASFLRSDLIARGVICNNELRARRSGERVTVSGLVTIRQRPGTANGVIFMTIEDETAVANIIVWPKTFERFRVAILGARYIAVTGELQQEFRRDPRGRRRAA